MKVCIYLRKSRADEELERTLGQGETLARHRMALLRYAEEKGYDIVKIHEELVSGEELFFRPAMLELLKEVEQKLYDAVLVMDIQRLGRGDMEEQGIILKTFKNSKTKIITPEKVYNLSNEFDEEYSEFEAFMSRKEYRMITRRMQGGRIRSVQEGNYIGTRPPYGYSIYRDGKKTRTLIPHPQQSEVIKLIFDWYVNKGMGCGSIANELNKLGIKSYTGSHWERTSITNFLKNPVYAGKVVWKKKCYKKSKTPGKKRDTYLRPRDEWIICDGKHEPIIDIETYNKAQELLQGKYHVPYRIENGVANPLAGIMICSLCGSKMKRRPYIDKKPHLICENKCGIKSNKIETVEKAVIEGIGKHLAYLRLNVDENNSNKSADKLNLIKNNLDSLNHQLKLLESQRLKTFDLLEQGIYDTATYTERSNLLNTKISSLISSIAECNAQISSLQNKCLENKSAISKLNNIIETYWTLKNPKEKNALLKSVLEKVTYFKDKTWKSDNFVITLHYKTRMNA
jgi:DNA invertase Pin-like site-specific DNA recombinase